MLRGELFLVSDTLTPADGAAHEYEARWHLKTTKWSHEKTTSATLTVDEQKPNLMILPLAAERA